MSLKEFEKSLFVGRYQHYYSESRCFLLVASCSDRGYSRKLVSSIGLYCSSSSTEERALRPGNEARKRTNAPNEVQINLELRYFFRLAPLTFSRYST